MKYIFLGGKAIGNYVLNGLIESNIIPEGIIVYRDSLDDKLISKVLLLNIRVLIISYFKRQQEDIKEFIKELDVDVYICVSFQFILPKEILDLVRFPINVHTGAIPKYRGHHPISAAFLNNEPFQATTVHLMAEEVDAGEILLQDFIKVENEDNILTIRQKLIELSFKLVLLVIKQIESNTLFVRKQVGETVWAPKRNPEDSRINFAKSSRDLHNFIRALVDPYPNAFCFSNGERVRIKQSIVSNTPGIVLAKAEYRKYVISTEDGVILVETDFDLKINDKLE